MNYAYRPAVEVFSKEAQSYAKAFAAIVSPGLMETKTAAGIDAKRYFRGRLEAYLAAAFDEGRQRGT